MANSKDLSLKELLNLGLIPNIADEETMKSVDMTMDNTYSNLMEYEEWRDKTKKAVRYGIKVNKNNPNPYARITYLYDAVGMTPAKMNYNTNKFEYGSWEDVWFVRKNRPVVLNYDGTEAYELNPNDYSKKLDGTDSGINDFSLSGNVMSRIPLVYVSMWEDSSYEYYVVSNVKYDETYKAIAHTTETGAVKDNIYLSVYEGSTDGTRVRSISGKDIMHSMTAEQEITRAKDNGSSWYTRTWGQRMLINILLMIMSKSDNSQEAFGNGVTNTYNASASMHGMVSTGTLNDKGQFFGYNDETHAMKVFHIENWWGNQWERIAGLILDYGKLKATFTGPYNLDGSGYEDVGITYNNSWFSGWQSLIKVTKAGRFPVEFNGSSNTYTSDYFWSDNSAVKYALVGGDCSHGFSCGSWYLTLNDPTSSASWHVGASISYV